MLDSNIKAIINKRNENILLYLIDNLNPILLFKMSMSEYAINNIYIGRVQKVKYDLNAAFIEINKNVIGFLPFNEINGNFLFNREFDGCLKENDRILVMINKEAVKTKPVSLTMNISIQGKYSVIHTDKPGLSVSSKIEKTKKTDLVKTIEKEINTDTIGITLRTKCNLFDNDYSKIVEEIHDLDILLKDILIKASSRSIYTLIYKSKPSYIERIQSIPYKIQNIITDDFEIYNVLKLYIDDISINLYEDPKINMGALYSLDKIYSEATSKSVNLKSGGSIIIEPTEALTVIDVNSGKINKKNKEESIRQINNEAAIEICRQLQLRNISGIIIIDFINYENKIYEEELINLIKKEIKKDSVKTSFIDITSLGLIELTRQKKYSSIYENNI